MEVQKPTAIKRCRFLCVFPQWRRRSPISYSTSEGWTVNYNITPMNYLACCVMAYSYPNLVTLENGDNRYKFAFTAYDSGADKFVTSGDLTISYLAVGYI